MATAECRTSPFRVMVADDDENIRVLLRLWLDRDERFAFAGEITNGADVIDEVGSAAPDALILDLSLPDRDGLSILAELREGGDDVAVVVFSASVGAEVPTTVTSYERSSFIDKGSNLADLGTALERHLASRPASLVAPLAVAPEATGLPSGGRRAATVAGLAGLAAVVGVLLRSAPVVGSPLLVAGFATAIAATFALPVRRVARSGGTTMQLDGHLYVALAMLVPPTGAALAAAVGVSVGLVLVRPRRTRFRIGCSTLLFAVQAFGQASLVALLVATVDAPWAAPVGGCLAYLLGLAWNLSWFAYLLQRTEGIPARTLLRRHLPTALRLMALVLPVGALVGSLGDRHPTALLFLAAPQVALLVAARAGNRSRREREALHRIVGSMRSASPLSTTREVEEHLVDLARQIVDQDVRLSRTRPTAAAGPAVAAVSLDGDIGPWLVAVDVGADEAALLELVAAVGAPARDNARLRALETFEARHDPLTGLANTRLLHESLDRAGSGYRLSGTPFSVVYVDLDRFKPVNDHFGHATGDEVLRTVARRIQGAVRPFDLVARQGGDEFVIVIAGVGDRVVVDRITGDLRRAVEAPIRLGDHTLTVGASIGVAVCPEDGVGADELLGRADDLMLRTKRGRAEARSTTDGR